MRRHYFTSESVSAGHPDKLCDFISDSVVDAFLRKTSDARVAVECLASTNRVILAGEVRPADLFDVAQLEDLVRDCVREIGYEQDGFHWEKLQFASYLHAQSADIAQGVDSTGNNKGTGAGDQGLMFGYACDETDMLMPAPIYYAHMWLRALAQARVAGQAPGLGPDAKCQLTLCYEDGVPTAVDNAVISSQHDATLTQQNIRDMVVPILAQLLPDGWMPVDDKIQVNPTGQFIIGGPDGDAGLTGRKIIVDTYGGAAPHGGGAFSGKDPTKVDRSAAYATRYLAKNIVAAGLARRCTVQISYAIGLVEPRSLYVDLHGTGEVDEAALEAALHKVMDLTPQGIRAHLMLDRPIYSRTAAYGHFGRPPETDGGFSWEKTDLGADIKAAL